MFFCNAIVGYLCFPLNHFAGLHETVGAASPLKEHEGDDELILDEPALLHYRNEVEGLEKTVGGLKMIEYCLQVQFWIFLWWH